jgi:phosphatidylglycerophosphate synthase
VSVATRHDAAAVVQPAGDAVPAVPHAQKRSDILAGFFPRKVSPYITAILLRTAITPNQTTILWGLISVANVWLVYYAIRGRIELIVAVFAVWVFTLTLDCVDGEIARTKRIVSPIAGKLLDGISHRGTEYGLLVAFALAARDLTGSAAVLPIGMLLVTGDAMYTYASERRTTALRVMAGYGGALNSTEGWFQHGTPWLALRPKQRLGTLTGLIQYPSAYFAIVLGNISGLALLGGLAAMAVYKHVAWMRLMARTIRQAKALTAEGGGNA